MCISPDLNEDQIKLQLYDAYFGGKDLGFLVSFLAEMLGNPIIVFDTSYKIVAHSDKTKVKDAFWEEFIEQGYCTYEFIARISALPSVKRGRSSSGAYTADCPQSDHDKLVCPILAEGRLLGNIIVLGCQNAFHANDKKILEDVSCMIGEKLKKTRLFYKSENILSEDLLYDLLEERCSNRQELEDRLTLAKLDLPENLQLLLFDLAEYRPQEVSSGRLKEKIQANWNFHPSFFCNGNIVTLCDSKKLESMEEAIMEFNWKNNIFLSVSRPFTDLLLSRSRYLEAKDTLMTGKRACPEKNIFHYYETIYFSLLPRMSDEQVYETFCHPVLQKLRNYDELHHSDLYRTLYVFFLFEGNIQKTADALFFHRNTVRYKIDKIVSLTGINVSNILETSDIFFSYRILNYYMPDIPLAKPFSILSTPASCDKR